MQITAKQVKELREMTGAGMMDCKKALQESEGNLEKAIEYLRKHGVAKAAKKSGRATQQGVIGSYIHSNKKVGVLLEVNCETDFVAKNEVFTTLVKELSMQIAAARPLYIAPEDVPEEIINKEKEIFKEQLEQDPKNAKKPDNIKEKIVEGRIKKYFKEICLLEQPYIRDDSKTVKDLITESIAKLGENIKVKRFVRFELGE